MSAPASPARGPSDPLAALRDPATIRLRCRAILQAVDDGRSSHFRLERTRLGAAAARVAALTRRRYPDLAIPVHGRWRHFEAGGVDRRAELEAALAGRDPAEVARARVDLTVVSVLLDAGAGAAWRYRESDGQFFSRSEGLGVASLRAFMAGSFAVDSLDPLRADPVALQRMTLARLAEAFQVMPSNPLIGLDGRVGLLQRLGALAERPGVMLFDRVVAGGPGGARRDEVSAAEILGQVLRALAPVWRSGSVVKGVPAGDVWPHRFAGNETAGGPDVTTNAFVPFHKLSQWLAYSLIEPFEWAGVRVTGLDALTGLPEYRNGGLLLDEGVIVPRDARMLERTWKPGDEFVVEWRALTVALLDELAVLVRGELGLTADQLPLARVLEGGTWAAGREVALERRDGGTPPFGIDSDGTVF